MFKIRPRRVDTPFGAESPQTAISSPAPKAQQTPDCFGKAELAFQSHPTNGLSAHPRSFLIS